MSSELAVYDRIGDPIAAMQTLGSAIARSKLFGCENEAQGQVLAMECLAKRLPPLSLAERYHLIEGKLSMKAERMLADFINIGGKFRVVSRTADAASIELTLGGQTITETLTWQDAQQEPFPYGKEKQLKKNWATPRARRQMLWARVVSEGVGTLAPGIRAGCYVPEEIDGYDGELPESSGGNGHASPAAASPVANPKPAGELVEAEYEIVKGEPDFCTSMQRDAIMREFARLQLDQANVEQIVAKHGGKSLSQLRELTGDQASALLEELIAIPPKTEMYVWEQASPVTVDEIKRLINVRQDKQLVEMIRAHLTKNGKQVIADLSQQDAEKLKSALMIGTMELFFGSELSRKPEKNS